MDGVRRSFGNESGFSLISALVLSTVAALSLGFATERALSALKDFGYVEQKSFFNLLNNKIILIQRNRNLWLETTMSAAATAPIFTPCLHDLTTPFLCPAHNASLSGDPYIASLIPASWTAPGLSTVPIVDLRGNSIAGATGSEVYYKRDGRPCNVPAPAQDCAFKATGFMIRENQNPNQNPGEMIFAIKVESVVSAGGSLLAMRPFQAAIDLSSTASLASPTPPSGSCQIGFTQVNGGPMGNGCIENAMSARGALKWHQAVIACYQDFGPKARLVNLDQWYYSAAAFPSLANPTNTREWFGYLEGGDSWSCTNGSSSSCQAEGEGVKRRYRCWVNL